MRRFLPHTLLFAVARLSKVPKKVLLSPLGVILLILPFFSSCDMGVKDPVLPTWTVPVNVPLAEETFKFSELVNDSTIVAQGADSMLFLSLEGSLESIEMSAADFNIASIDTTHSFQMGSLQIGSLDVLKSGPITLGSFFPDLANLVSGGQTIPFTMPDTTFEPAPTILDAGDFIGMRVVSGQMRIRFTNNLPFPIGPNAEHPQGLRISVFDSTGAQVVNLLIDQLVATGETVERASAIGGVGSPWIYAPFRTEYVLPIAQQTTFQLSSDVLNNAGVEVDVSLENLEVDEAIARMESQEVENHGGFALDDDIQLREAAIEAGFIRLDFNNQTSVNMTLDFTMPNIITAQGDAYSGSLNISENSSTTLQVPLAGMHISSPGNTGELMDSILIDYRTVTSASSNIIHLSSSDRIDIGIHIESIEFGSVSGYIQEKVFDIDPFEQSDLADYEGVPNNIALDFVDFALRLSNEFFIENMLVNLDIVGYHEENGVVTDSARMQIQQQSINPGLPGSPGITVITVPGDEAAVFLNILPTRIRTFGSILGSGELEVHQNSSVSGEYSFSTPLRFRIDGEANYTGDVTTLDDQDIGKEIRDAADDNFEEATLSLHLTNSTPLGGTIRLIVSGDAQHSDIYDDTYFNPSLEFIKEVTVTPAQADPNTGFVTASQNNEITLSLTRDEFRIFKNPPLNVGYELRLDGTDGVVSLRANDFVTVSGTARVQILIKDK